jgi:hypothetical protein
VESHKAETEKVGSKKHSDWYEFTPFEIGSDEHGGKTTFFLSDKNFVNFTNLYFSFLAWIPTWAFGREFNPERVLVVHRNKILVSYLGKYINV